MEQTALVTASISIGIGIIIVGLVRYIFVRERGLLMTREDHHEACDKAQKNWQDSIRDEFASFREHFDDQLDIKVMKSLKELNGTLEAKIESIVSNQVKSLKNDLQTKLDLVEILKAVLSKDQK